MFADKKDKKHEIDDGLIADNDFGDDFDDDYKDDFFNEYNK